MTETRIISFQNKPWDNILFQLKTLPDNTSINTLDFRVCDLDDTKATKILDILKNNCSITAIFLSYNDKIVDKAIYCRKKELEQDNANPKKLQRPLEMSQKHS